MGTFWSETVFVSNEVGGVCDAIGDPREWTTNGKMFIICAWVN